MKAILYLQQDNIDLMKFGISITLLKSRKQQTLETLMQTEEISDKMDEWLITENPYTISKKDLERIHSPEYCSVLFSDKLEDSLIKAFELINPDGSYNRYNPEEAVIPLRHIFKQVLNMAAGTFCALRIALERGFCYYLGGGMHHGHRNFGHGFCPTNDIMLAARRIQYEKRAQRIWIIDVDAHKGDGTADMAGGDDSVRTLSIHMAGAWPLDQPEFDDEGNFNPVHHPSDIDIAIKSGEEAVYLERLSEGLHRLENMSEQIEKPDLAIIVQGADPYENDELPSTDNLNLTLDQMLKRDQLVYQFLNDRKIPTAYTMAGGYGRYSWEVYSNFLRWVMVQG